MISFILSAKEEHLPRRADGTAGRTQNTELRTQNKRTDPSASSGREKRPLYKGAYLRVWYKK